MNPNNSICLRISEGLFNCLREKGKGFCECRFARKRIDDNLGNIFLVSKEVASLNEIGEKRGILLYFNFIDQEIPEDVKKLAAYIVLKKEAGSENYEATLRDGDYCKKINKISIIEADLFFIQQETIEKNEINLRTMQTFGLKTTSLLSKMTIGVVGLSGTGSPVAEMLYRLGVGKLVVVDDDKTEEKNLGRIYNSAKDDIGTFKVEMFASACRRHGLTTVIEPFARTTEDPIAVRALSQCDIIFGCVDTHTGRRTLDLICNYYLIPIIDIGVKLISDSKGGIDACCYSINYIRPGASTLFSRKIINSETMAAEGLKYSNPEEYTKQIREKYIKGVNENSPAVISINTMAAAHAVNEFLARIHHYRNVDNKDIAQVSYNLMEPERIIIVPEAEFAEDLMTKKVVGFGDIVPLLGKPNLSE